MSTVEPIALMRAPADLGNAQLVRELDLIRAHAACVCGAIESGTLTGDCALVLRRNVDDALQDLIERLQAPRVPS
jgi:hypothetical protein